MFIAQIRHGRNFLKKIGFQTHQVRNTLLIGGGRTGYYLAKALLDAGVSVKIIEHNQERCEDLSEILSDAVVIRGDALNADLLQEVGIETAESVVALTGFDEENILLTLHAREVSNAKTITKINRLEFHQVIENLEQEYENAPEEKVLEEVKPQFGLEEDDGMGGTYIDEDGFIGVAVTEDGTPFRYILKSFGSTPMSAKIENNKKYEQSEQADALFFWHNYDSFSADNDIHLAEPLPAEEEMETEIGISFEEAKALTDEKVAALQIPGMELADWEYGLCTYQTNSPENHDIHISDTGYIMHYTRKVDGIPITYSSEYGGALEDMDSEMETWSYERLDFCVTEDGIDQVEFINQYDIGQVKTERVNLKSFDEIMDIYEKMMLIQNADTLNSEDGRVYHIDRITFGYSRIYEPATDSKSGVLVPVWDFFGSFEGFYTEEQQAQGAPETFGNYDTNMSYLTINAIDGSVIDRGLGY